MTKSALTRALSFLMALLFSITLLAVTIDNDYALAAKKSETEPNNSFFAAQSLGFGETVVGTVNGNNDREDYYKFELKKSGQIVILFESETTLSENFAMGIYDSHENYISLLNLSAENGSGMQIYDRYNGTRSIKLRLPAGVYYLYTYTMSYDTYALTVNFTAESVGDFEIEPNSSLESANTITLGKTISGNLGRGTFEINNTRSTFDIDYFKFDLTYESKITVTYDVTGGVPNHIVTLTQIEASRFSSSEQSIERWVMGNIPYPAQRNLTLPAGTYYINIQSSYDGKTDVFNDYQLTVSVEQSEEPAEKLTNNTVEDQTEESAEAAEFAKGTSSWATESVKKAIELNLAPADLLKDWQNNITREEFCRMAVQTLMAKSESLEDEAAFLAHFGITEVGNNFSDTGNRYVNIAYQLQIANGTGNGKFDPNGSITRESAATLLKNAAAVFEFTTYPGSSINFEDIESVSSWARGGVNFVSATGVMSGSNNKFSPRGRYTREQAIITMLNLFNAFPRDHYAF